MIRCFFPSHLTEKFFGKSKLDFLCVLRGKKFRPVVQRRRPWIWGWIGECRCESRRQRFVVPKIQLSTRCEICVHVFQIIVGGSYCKKDLTFSEIHTLETQLITTWRRRSIGIGKPLKIAFDTSKRKRTSRVHGGSWLWCCFFKSFRCFSSNKNKWCSIDVFHVLYIFFSCLFLNFK